MAKGFALSDFYDLISVNASISKKTAEKVWNTILDMIISELQYNDYISINNFGRFDKVEKGGKDEECFDDFGNIVKRYVEPVSTIEWKPSVSFIKALNENSIEQMGKVKVSDPLFDYGDVLVDSDYKKTLEDEIALVLSRKGKRRDKERKREEDTYIPQRNGEIPKKEINIKAGKKIKCLTTNKVYSSMSKCGKELNLRVAQIKKSLETGEPIYGYRFVEITEEQYLEALKELEEMKKRNENAEL